MSLGQRRLSVSTAKRIFPYTTPCWAAEGAPHVSDWGEGGDKGTKEDPSYISPKSPFLAGIRPLKTWGFSFEEEDTSLFTAGRILASSRRRSGRPMRRLGGSGRSRWRAKLGPLSTALVEPLRGDRPVSRGTASQ